MNAENDTEDDDELGFAPIDELETEEEAYADETDAVFGCACEKDADELVIRACGAHRIEYSTERRIREAMDSEIDVAIYDLTGSRRPERKDGAVFGTFAIARKPV